MHDSPSVLSLKQVSEFVVSETIPTKSTDRQNEYGMLVTAPLWRPRREGKHMQNHANHTALEMVSSEVCVVSEGRDG